MHPLTLSMPEGGRRLRARQSEPGSWVVVYE
jgi:hypothetical protein